MIDIKGFSPDDDKHYLYIGDKPWHNHDTVGSHYRVDSHVHKKSQQVQINVP